MPLKTFMAVAAIFLLLTAGCGAAKKPAADTTAPAAKTAAPKVKATAPVETPATGEKTAVPEAKAKAPVGQKAAKVEAPAKKEASPIPQKPPRTKEFEDIDDWISVLNRELQKPELAPMPPAEKVMKGEIAAPQTAKKEPPESTAPGKDGAVSTIKTLKVRVLSGDGKLASAKALSRRLAKMGYRISGVDYASKSSFEGTTIFFAKDYNEAAKRMAEQLGGKAVCKPITWKSAYHLIVITGK